MPIFSEQLLRRMYEEAQQTASRADTLGRQRDQLQQEEAARAKQAADLRAALTETEAQLQLVRLQLGNVHPAADEAARDAKGLHEILTASAQESGMTLDQLAEQPPAPSSGPDQPPASPPGPYPPPPPVDGTPSQGTPLPRLPGEMSRTMRYEALTPEKLDDQTGEDGGAPFRPGGSGDDS